MVELFSDIFAGRDNALVRLDPRAKLSVAVAGILAALFSGGATLPIAVFVVCLSGLFAVRIPARWVLARLAGPAVIASVLVLLQSFLVGATPLFGVSVAGVRFTAMAEGARHGLLLGARVLGCSSIVLLLGSVTPAHRVFHVLRWAGVPGGWVEIAMLTYRYTFVLLDQAAEVSAAQRVRLGYSGPGRSLSSMGILGGTVLLRSVDQASRTAEAMSARGYSGQIGFGPMGPMRRADRLVAGVAPPILLAAYLLAEGMLP
ncbi:MAG: cobalt ECF transporter T component CbiQ [Deltaproteobacteria bacterium]|nr:cobalt ECF transporter T component CbiQ [Deltaproteobacteria bacterium]